MLTTLRNALVAGFAWFAGIFYPENGQNSRFWGMFFSPQATYQSHRPLRTSRSVPAFAQLLRA